MRKETRLAYHGYLDQLASLNGIPSAAEQFAVDPSVQQTLESRMQDNSDFLKRINMPGVSEQQGEKIGLGIGTPIASTTKTSGTGSKDRAPSDPTTLGNNKYNCTQTNSDTYITYAKLDAWAKFPDFQARVRDQILTRQALDRITIGFNGTSRADTSDITANPLLQDVNIGWLQQYRTNATARVMTEVVDASGKITVGAGKDYENLDALVYDAINNLIEPWYQDSTELVAICSRDLLHAKYFNVIDQALAPTEMRASDVILAQKRLGGIPAMRVPNFPTGKIFITATSNLSIYWQEGSRRRTVVDNAKRDRIENYESSNDAYVVEDYGFGCLLENITLS